MPPQKLKRPFNQVYVPPGRTWPRAIWPLLWAAFWSMAGPLLVLELLWLCTGFLIVAPWSLLGGKSGVAIVAVMPVLVLFGEGYLGVWAQLMAAVCGLGILFVLIQNLLLRAFPRAPRPGLSLGIRAGLSHLWPVCLLSFYPPLAVAAGLVVMVLHVRLLRRSHPGPALAPILSHAMALALVMGLATRLPQDLRVDLLPWFRGSGLRMDLREVKTPRAEKEHRAEIAALRAHPYVLPQNINYEMARADLPPDVRFLIAKEGADGSSDAMRWLGDCYYQGIGTAQDPQTALACWDKAIQRDGNAEAKLSKGAALLEGRSLAKDEAGGKDLILSVVRWASFFRKSALARLRPLELAEEDKDLEAKLSMAEVTVQFPNLHDSTKAKLEELRARVAARPQLWVYAAALDALQVRLDPPPAPPAMAETRAQVLPTITAPAAHSVAIKPARIEGGRTIPIPPPPPPRISYEEQTLRQLAGQGDPVSMGKLALLLGEGNPPEGANLLGRHQEALEWANKAIQLGNRDRRLPRMLAWIYEGSSGDRALVNPTKALNARIQADDFSNLTSTQLQASSDRKVPGAMAQLGIFRYYGQGGFSQDKGEGVRLLQAATTAGYQSYWADETLARAYSEGSGGLPKDPAQAQLWRDRAKAFPPR